MQAVVYVMQAELFENLSVDFLQIQAECNLDCKSERLFA